MHARSYLTLAAVLAGSIALTAQTQAPNRAGVFAAHTHLTTTDLAASNAFWTAVGGAETQIGSMNGVRMPGLYILFQMNRGRGGRGAAARGQNPATSPTGTPAPAAVETPPSPPESSVGSVVDAIGIKEKNLKATLTALAALGVTPEPGATATTAAVMSPERVRVLLIEDSSLATSCMTYEWLMKVPDPREAAAWYQKWFGATVTTAGSDVIAQVPGMDLHFVRASGPLAGTRGRALDHIGFDVIDLPTLVSKMQADGVAVATPYRTINLGFLTGLAFVTDPWGTYIELNQGYDGH